MREAYRQTREVSAPGMDQVTAQQYAEHLDENLRDLHERLRSGRYVAPPVERVWIEKDDGKKTPDRQTLLRGQDCPASGGDDAGSHLRAGLLMTFPMAFGKGHSPHQALHELREQCRTLHITWIVDADVSGFFDSIDWTPSAGGSPAAGQ